MGRQLLLGLKGEIRSINIPAGSMRVRITDITLNNESLNRMSTGGADHAL
ncbi:hypothetical protein [Paenibacillus sp. 1A_MP2]